MISRLDHPGNRLRASARAVAPGDATPAAGAGPVLVWALSLLLWGASGLACGPKIIHTQLEEVTLCRDVSRTGEGIPVERTDRFSSRDNQAVLWVRLSELKGPHTVRFRWYDPWENLYLDTGPVPVNEEGAFRRKATVSGPLPIAGASPSILPGSWRVEAYYDGTPIAEESFEIFEHR